MSDFDNYIENQKKISEFQVESLNKVFDSMFKPYEEREQTIAASLMRIRLKEWYFKHYFERYERDCDAKEKEIDDMDLEKLKQEYNDILEA